MSQVKLSICIPTYNRAPFLEKALNYFVELYQFSFKYEIVISDNASTDSTREIVDRFIAKGLPIEGRWYTGTFRNALIGYLDGGSLIREFMVSRAAAFLRSAAISATLSTSHFRVVMITLRFGGAWLDGELGGVRLLPL